MNFKDGRFVPSTNALYWFWVKVHNRQPYCIKTRSGERWTIGY